MRGNDFEIERENFDGGVRFILEGRINSLNYTVLEDKLNETLHERHRNIILNMLRVDHLSSAGIKVILKAYKDAQKLGGRLGIEGPSENVRNVLGMTALDTLLIK